MRRSILPLIAGSLLASFTCAARADTLTFTAAGPSFLPFDPNDGVSTALLVTTSLGTSPSAVNPSDFTANTLTIRLQAPAGKQIVANLPAGFPDIRLALFFGTGESYTFPFSLPDPVISFENFTGPAPSSFSNNGVGSNAGPFNADVDLRFAADISFTAVEATWTFPPSYNLTAPKTNPVPLMYLAVRGFRSVTDPGDSWVTFADLPPTPVPLPAASLMGLALLPLAATTFLVTQRRRAA